MYEDYGFEPVMPMLLPDTYYLWQVVVVLDNTLDRRSIQRSQDL